MHAKIREFIVNDLGRAGADARLSDDYPLIENDIIDSMGIFQIVGFLEEECGIEVDDEDLVPDNFATLGAIVRLVESKRGVQPV